MSLQKSNEVYKKCIQLKLLLTSLTIANKCFARKSNTKRVIIKNRTVLRLILRSEFGGNFGLFLF